MRLRAIELKVTDVSRVAAFFQETWGLIAVDPRHFRGTGDHPYIVSLTAARSPGIEAITFVGTPEEIARLPGEKVASFDAPGGGSGVLVEGPEGQRYRFVTESGTQALPADRNRPLQLSHAVLNTKDWEASERFAVEKLGFRVSDRTKMMRFLRCDRKHHAIAYVNSDISSLNHIAFEMRDLDAVMHGIGRLREAGYECVWGPGRHGPGNNVFGYFIAPFGGVVEYTAEVAEAGDEYRVGGPDDWTWPPGRMDHWGVSTRNTPVMHAAERTLTWTSVSGK
jgi:catechol 2,3-dioxygenase-like lactoylglutathione lyase family enzyme